MTTDNKSGCINTNTSSGCTYYHNNWYLQYPNGPYWIIPDYQYPYNPPINTPQPMKLWNSGSTTTITTYKSMISPEVNILVNKNRVRSTKPFNGTSTTNVYLNEGEFAIEIFNPNNYTIGAKFKLNGKYISTSHLVIYAGQRLVLDRYIDTKDKFKFTIYTVDKNNAAVEKAIQGNGDLEIEFYQEQETQPYYPINEPYIYGGSFGNAGSNNVFYCANLGSGTLTNTGGINTTTTTTANLNAPSTRGIVETKETGIVDKGGHSNQSLTYVDKTFATLATFITKFKLLPMSEKPIEAKDLVIHCTGCGHKAKRHHKFCSNCGTKIE